MDGTAISVHGLTKIYGNVKALDGVSFEVKKGEIFSYLGPNGSGKTTTVEILEGIRKPTSGKAEVLGYDVVKEARKIHKRIGVLPQDFSAFDRLTVEENLKVFCSLYPKGPTPEELMELVGLTEMRKVRFEKLSGGLKQRLGIAAALAGNPELVFLDEPTTGLDPKARRETWEVIRRLKREGRTVFLTTHYMEEAEVLSDRVAVIVKGKIVAIGSPSELIDKYANYYILRIKETGQTFKAPLDELLPKTRELAGRGAGVELLRPSFEEVFLKLVGARITEEGELA